MKRGILDIVLGLAVILGTPLVAGVLGIIGLFWYRAYIEIIFFALALDLLFGAPSFLPHGIPLPATLAASLLLLAVAILRERLRPRRN